MSTTLQCLTCEHYTGLWACKAYPRGIPIGIRQGTIDHRREFEGDHGIRYKPMEGAEAADPTLEHAE
jgi:hypothetical protein